MPRPTCKAAVIAGNKAGAQIYPKGCKVRTRVNKDGLKTRKNAAGKTKTTVVVENDTKLKVQVAMHGKSAQFLWDTGAEVTMMGFGTAKQWRLLDSDGRPIGAHSIGGIVTASNQRTESFIFKRKRIVVSHSGRQFTVTTDVNVARNGQRLLGVPAIRALRRECLIVKFK